MIMLRDVVKTYSNAAGDFTVLKGISTEIEPGEFVGVIGKSGSGKSTLINMVTGIDRPSSGDVFVGDTEVHALNESQLALWRGRNLGIVFQFFQLLPMLSLVENVMLPMDFCGMYARRQRRDRAMHLLELVEMQDHADKLPSAISGGQQQRVAIARALANDPPIVIADEPTGNLDSHTAGQVFALFEELIAEGKTLLMVTHDTSLARRVTRTLLIADGEIVNEYVARALPSLTHEQMLQVTRQLDVMHFDAGATILHEEAEGDRFYIVTRGVAEVVLPDPGGVDVVVSRPTAGDYLGEIELLRGGPNRATVRASLKAPVEVAALSRAQLQDLLGASPETRAALEQMAAEREAENLSVRERNGH